MSKHDIIILGGGIIGVVEARPHVQLRTTVVNFDRIENDFLGRIDRINIYNVTEDDLIKPDHLPIVSPQRTQIKRHRVANSNLIVHRRFPVHDDRPPIARLQPSTGDHQWCVHSTADWQAS